MSAKEKGMPGAPQGLIFDVVVTETGDVPESQDVSGDVEVRG